MNVIFLVWCNKNREARGIVAVTGRRRRMTGARILLQSKCSGFLLPGHFFVTDESSTVGCRFQAAGDDPAIERFSEHDFSYCLRHNETSLPDLSEERTHHS